MAQIAASDVVYTYVEGTGVASPGNPMKSAIFTVAFGNGTLTYTNGGVPLTKAKLGCPASIQELYLINDNCNDGIVYKYNHTAASIQMYQAPTQSHGHTLTIVGGITTADILYNNAGVFGKAAATNVTINSGTVATTGGIASAALVQASLAEISTATAVSATTLRMRVVGF